MASSAKAIQALAPIAIPPRTRDASGAAPALRRQREYSQRLAVAASVVLVALVVMELGTAEHAADDVRQWSFWVVKLVFPSQHVTWIKIVCLALGFVLTSSYFLSSQAQLASAEKMMIYSATVMVSPLRRSQQHQQMHNDPNAPTPTGKTTAAWLASRNQDTDHFGGGRRGSGAEDEIPQLRIRDECKRSAAPVSESELSEFEAVNRAQPLAIESEYFQGHVLFMVKDRTKPPSDSRRGNWEHLFENRKRMLWVQVQGRFKKPLPPRSVLYLATELPSPDGFQVAFLTRQLVSLLIALVKKFVPTAHIAFGDKAATDEDNELPHAAFPLYQTVDEFVVTDESESHKIPSFGQERFGEPVEAKKIRAETPVGLEPATRTDAVYSFQFYTMYSDLAQWKIVNLPGMPDMDLRRFCGKQPIRLAAYAVVTPGLHPGILCDLPHKHKDKEYLFCLSVHNEASRSSSSNVAAMPQQAIVSQQDAAERLLSPPKAASISRPPSLPLRWRSVSCDQPDAVVRQQFREADELRQHEAQMLGSGSPTVGSRPQPRIRASASVRNMTTLERAADLSNWKFTLPVWVERVDPAAGNRKVAYLFVVEEKQPTSMNVKPQRRCVIRSAQTVKNTLFLLDTSDLDEHAREFRKLLVESREFMYETISRETEQVAKALQAIATISADEASEVDKGKQAMLFNCLMSESRLPCVRSYQDIGIQLTKAKRDQLDIIFEKGIYRMVNPRFLRQEWFILTTTELNFFRSYSLKPKKIIHLSHVLSIQTVDNVPFFEDARGDQNAKETRDISPRQLLRGAAMRSTNTWFGVEIQVLSEVLTLFFDCASDRTLCISSLNQLIKLRSVNVSSKIPGRLPPARSFDAMTAPICCNQRNLLSPHLSPDASLQNPVKLAEELVEIGLRLYKHSRDDVRREDAVAFLDAAERLTAIDLNAARTSVATDLGHGRPTVATNLTHAGWFPTDAQRLSFALNLFHALYIHAWLLCGDATTPAQWKKLKTLVQYAVGSRSKSSQVLRLSLADIEHIVQKGHNGHREDGFRALAKLPSISVPAVLTLDQRDFRTSLALQTNCPPHSHGIIRTYHPESLQTELNQTSANFLDNEVIVDSVHRLIQLPKVCEWGADDGSGGTTSALIGSRAFLCLQTLLPLMNKEQHDRVQHLLLGAVKECQIKFSARFWTQELAHRPKSPTTSATGALSTSLPVEMSKSVLTTHFRDDSMIVGARAGVTEAGDGIPRSKSALQFLQSFF